VKGDVEGRALFAVPGPLLGSGPLPRGLKVAGGLFASGVEVELGAGPAEVSGAGPTLRNMLPVAGVFPGAGAIPGDGSPRKKLPGSGVGRGAGVPSRSTGTGKPTTPTPEEVPAGNADGVSLGRGAGSALPPGIAGAAVAGTVAAAVRSQGAGVVQGVASPIPAGGAPAPFGFVEALGKAVGEAAGAVEDRRSSSSQVSSPGRADRDGADRDGAGVGVRTSPEGKALRDSSGAFSGRRSGSGLGCAVPGLVIG